MPFLHPSRTRGSVASYGADYSFEKGFPQIKVGATNEESGGAVAWVAKTLGAWGITSEGGKVFDYSELADISGARDSGIFTKELAAAVEKFQKAKGLSVDGVVGKDTYKALGYTGKVVTGASLQRSSGGGGSRGGTTVSAAPLPGAEESITDKVWFWPVAILVPMAAVIGGILFWPSKKTAAASPVAIPVASNPRRRRSKRRR